MNYYLDTEFIEGFKKPIKWLPTIGNFNKPYHSIQLISIGIVAEDGREYYAVSNEYNYNDANDWVKENVILNIYREQIAAFKQQYMDIKTFHKHIPKGKSNKRIAEEVAAFCMACKESPDENGRWELLGGGLKQYKANIVWDYPTFYGYYADYDWVLFCSLFGTMMQLPKGFPMYCKDLKQMLDEKPLCYKPQTVKVGETHVLGIDPYYTTWKEHNDYPKQTNEHNALADARWNKSLHEFLKQL